MRASELGMRQDIELSEKQKATLKNAKHIAAKLEQALAAHGNNHENSSVVRLRARSAKFISPLPVRTALSSSVGLVFVAVFVQYTCRTFATSPTTPTTAKWSRCHGILYQ